MKRLFFSAAILAAIAVLSLVAYRGFWESANTSSTSLALSSDQAQAQGRLLARLRFDPASFGGCSVHDAWLEESSTYVARGWFWIRLEKETVTTTEIHVVMAMPDDPAHPSTHLSFEETDPAANRLGVTGSSTQSVRVNGVRRSMFDSNTVFPPPAVMKFTCGEGTSQAVVEGKTR